MTSFEAEYFKKVKSSPSQIQSFMRKAFRDLEIASKDPFSEVRFMFAYQALVKSGIALLAHSGVKVRSVPGHHIKIVEKMSDLLRDSDILVFGNAMRMKRNEDLYSDSGFVSEKEVSEYLDFVKNVLQRVKKELG